MWAIQYIHTIGVMYLFILGFPPALAYSIQSSAETFGRAGGLSKLNDSTIILENDETTLSSGPDGEVEGPLDEDKDYLEDLKEIIT